jgi:cytochrome c-type biogenesis protein CcmH
MTRLALVAGALAVVLAVGLAAMSRGPETAGDRVARLAAELRCPVCQGLSVNDSPSDTAREMRALIERRVAEGRSDDEIRDEFRRSYGDWILLSPPLADARGLVWLVPIVLIAAGALVAAARVGRAPPPVRAPSPEQLALLRERARTEVPE